MKMQYAGRSAQIAVFRIQQCFNQFGIHRRAADFGYTVLPDGKLAAILPSGLAECLGVFGNLPLFAHRTGDSNTL